MPPPPFVPPGNVRRCLIRLSRLIIFIKGSIIAKILKQLREQKRRLKREYALRKRIKNVIMSTRKNGRERARERNHSRVPNWIIYVRYVRQSKVFTCIQIVCHRVRLICIQEQIRLQLGSCWNQLVGCGRGCLSHLLGIKLRPQKIELYFMRFITIYFMPTGNTFLFAQPSMCA